MSSMFRHLMVAAVLAVAAIAPAHAQVDALDISITQSLSDPAPFVGDAVTLTITVGNAGPSNALTGNMSASPPSAFNISSYTASVGSVAINSFNTVAWANWGGLAAGTSITLQLFGTFTTAGSFSSTATAISPTGNDTNFSNNTSTLNFRVRERTTTVPEPGSLALLGLGLVGLASSGRRRRT